MKLNHSFGLALIAAFTGAAQSQQIPPPEDGEKIVSVTRVGNQAEMRDIVSGAPIILPKGAELWEDKNNANNLEPTIDLRPQPAGFDVVYTFVNEGPNSRKLGALNVGILTLGHRVDYPDIRNICEPKYADFDEGYKVLTMQYPDTLYSPAWVLQNQDYAVGLSIQYPILDYEHDVRLCLSAPGGKYDDGEGGRGWKIEFLLSNVGNETEDNKLTVPGRIEAGQTRIYVVSVRVTRKTTEWLRTLVPYRNWFRGQYGGVAYERNPRCVNTRSVTSGDLCTNDNPFGFGEGRPDLLGWEDHISNMLLRKNWDTLLFMTASGSYFKNWTNNMPYQFTTNWNANPALATALDPAIGFPRLPAAGQKIGLWWGRSVQVADQWDDPTLVPFNPELTGHRNRAFAELDLAVKAGATTVGLDTFITKHTPLWEEVIWLHDLKARYPGMRFVTEPVSCDIVHREVPTFYRGHKDRYEVDTPDEIDGFYNPFFLADFLIPGHETWGAFRWSTYEEFGIYFTDEEKTEKLRQIASLGYSPCARDYFELQDGTIEAANSWEYTVPPDLQIPPDDQEDLFPTFDLFDTAYKAGDTKADLNKDGKLSLFDYTAWQNSHL